VSSRCVGCTCDQKARKQRETVHSPHTQQFERHALVRCVSGRAERLRTTEASRRSRGSAGRGSR
jgi:hypothetical protein